MIYFLRESGDGDIKIGWTKSNEANARRLTLQTGNPRDLVLMGTLPGTRAEESRLHDQFAEFKIRGEWFRAAPELLDAVRSMLFEGGSGATVKEELDRRNGCRSGLKGVMVAAKGLGAELFVIESSYWARGRILNLAIYPKDGPPPVNGYQQLQAVYESGGTLPPKTVVIDGRVKSMCAAYAPCTEWPMGSFHDVPAEDCILMSDWPIVCTCWMED